MLCNWWISGVTKYKIFLFVETQPYCYVKIISEKYHLFSFNDRSIQFQCYVKYNGSWCPIMRWIQVDGPKTSTTSKNVTDATSIQYNAYLNKTFHWQNIRYTWSLYFNNITNIALKTSGAPPEYTWNSSVLHVTRKYLR